MKESSVRAALFLGIAWLSIPGFGFAQETMPSTAKPAAAGCGAISSGRLKCSHFGFSYKIPFGWVDRTGQMQADSADATGAGPNQPQTLLAVFERPPGAAGETINSAVVIAAESLANYHGIKTASDYFGPIGELAEQRGFKVAREPEDFAIGSKHLVRGDFSKDRGKLTMWQSSLVMIEKGSIVSFTFVGGTEDEVESLIENLSFATRAPQKPAPPK
jgi:hypothetical protein